MKFAISAVVILVLLLLCQFGHSNVNTKQNNARNLLSQQSHTEEFVGVPELFDIMISVDFKTNEQWTVFTYPVDIFDLVHMQRLKRNVDADLADVSSMSAINCTVIYMNQCTSWNKCRSSCHSFGASSYRWFHDGCCECVAATCINYGVNESRCKYCPESFDDDEEVDWTEETNWHNNND